MTADLLQNHAPAAQDALRSFLNSVLDGDADLELGAPTEAERADLQDELNAGLAVGVENTFIVALDTAWVGLIAEAMLGRALDVTDDGADDLVREVASQGYGTLRNQLSAEDVKLPDLSIASFLPDDAVPPLGEATWRIPFQLTHDGTAYSGYALLPRDADPDAAADAPDASEAAPDAEEAPAAAPDPAPTAAGDDGPPADAPAAGQGGVSVTSANFSELGEEKIHGPRAKKKNFELLSEVELEVSVELGRRRLPLSDVLQLTSGSVIELEKLVGEPLSLYANGRFVAEGEAVVIDEKFGIRITSLAPKKQRSEALM